MPGDPAQLLLKDPDVAFLCECCRVALLGRCASVVSAARTSAGSNTVPALDTAPAADSDQRKGPCDGQEVLFLTNGSIEFRCAKSFKGGNEEQLVTLRPRCGVASDS